MIMWAFFLQSIVNKTELERMIGEEEMFSVLSFPLKMDLCESWKILTGLSYNETNGEELCYYKPALMLLKLG